MSKKQTEKEEIQIKPRGSNQTEMSVHPDIELEKKGLTILDSVIKPVYTFFLGLLMHRYFRLIIEK